MEDSALLSLAQREARKFVESEEEAMRLLQEFSTRASSITPAGLVRVG
jgi:hypothetical protein